MLYGGMLLCCNFKQIEPIAAEAIKKDCTLKKGLGDSPPRLHSTTHRTSQKGSKER